MNEPLLQTDDQYDIEQGIKRKKSRTMITNVIPRKESFNSRLIAWIIFVAMMCCCVIFYITGHHESKGIGTTPTLFSKESDYDERAVPRLLLSAEAHAMEMRTGDEQPKEDSMSVTDLERSRESSIEKWIYLFTEIEHLETRRAQILDDGFPVDSIDRRLTKKRTRMTQLDALIDKLTMDLQPDVTRTISKLPRSQGHEPTCWMFAAATLLRTKQHVLTPHADLVSELKRIEKQFNKFKKKFKILYDEDTVHGIKYWMKSSWWKLTQTQSMEHFWPYSWIDTYSGWTELLPNVFAQKLVLERFFSKHGFQLSETIFLDKKHEKFSWRDQDWDLRMFQLAERIAKEPALVAFTADSWKKIREHYMYSAVEDDEGTAGHGLVLETFDAKTDAFILKNSHGPSGGTPEREAGRVHIRTGAFKVLGGQIQFMEKRTSVRGTGWLWAAATLIQDQQTVNVPLGDIVLGINLEWHKISKTVWEINKSTDVAEWGEQVKEWGLYRESSTHSRWQQRVSATTHKLLAIEAYSNSRGLQFSRKKRFPGGLSSRKQWLLSNLQTQGALVLLDTDVWQRISAEFTNFREENGNESNPGPAQLMHLLMHDEADSDFWLKDTHGIKGGEPGAENGWDLYISEEDLPEFDIWFLEKIPVTVETGINNAFTYWDISPTVKVDIRPERVFGRE